ncbi:class II aldolase/adducin family protein [Dyella humicola]|uniref:class II aldolase/adducin family protein n=1 Tax=Dyella humicola TaxID=2992126 RepID=UPI0022506364|nr:class II aldolase/adducin family protein [Dyella humicola]
MKFPEIREQVVRMSVMLADHGFFAATGGNLALKVDAEHIAVTPSAVDYYQMGPEDVCILRLRDLAKVDGERKPSVETGMHAKVLQARPDCAASIHTHQPIASACTLIGKPLRVTGAGPRELLGDNVPIVGYAPSGTSWLSKKLAKALRPDANAYLLRTHGAICCGTSAERALQAIVALEAVALDYLRGRIAARAALLPQEAALQRLLTTLNTELVRDMVL